MYQLNNTESFFDTVQRTYNETKPVISQQCTKEDDVRPIGQRRYKWERIMKVDDNTYVLIDGFWGGHWQNQVNVTTAMAPILVQRRADGDYIRVRNGTKGSSWTSRYNFLMKHLPRGMRFHAKFKEGKHTIYLPQTDKVYPLPKGTFKYDYSTCVIEHDGNEALWFKQVGAAEFERAGHELEVKTTRIDLQAKRAVKPQIEEFYRWMCTMAPMLQDGWEAKKMWMDELSGSSWRFLPEELDAKMVCDIFADTTHEKRVALAGVLCIELGFRHINYAEDAKSFRSKYNRLANRLLRLHKTEMV